jgi:hypothetical protein
MQSFRQRNPTNIRRAGRKWTLLCFGLLLLAGAEFAVRGPARAIHSATQFNDFLSPYIQANAWMRGLDPYSPETLLRLWPAGAAHFLFLPKEVADGTLIAKRGIPTAYPITSLVLIAPVSLLPWKVVYALWLAINLGLFSVMLWMLVELAGFSYRDPSAILLVAATLALAPFHTGIVTGNVALVAVELGVIAVWAARMRYEITTAILLAVSAGLKPQIGLCFLLYYLVRRRWRVSGIALALIVLLAGVGLLRLELGHTPWLGNYLNDNRVLLESGILANFTPVNPMRFGLINLQVVLYSFVGSIGLANDLAASIGAILLIVWLIGMRRRSAQANFELLDLSAIVVVSLLPVYHRFYDAALLVFPLCWVFISFRKSRIIGTVSLLLMLPFLIPGGTLLETMQDSGRIPSILANRWWWGMFVMPHQVWMLFFLSILLLYEMSIRRFSPTTSDGTAGDYFIDSHRMPTLE